MARPPARANAVATPERVLQAAESTFAAVGFSTAKLADIASRAGIRRPSLLYHFRSKEQLYAATVERVFVRLRQALVEVMTDEGDFADRLVRTVQRYCEFVDAEPQLARIVLRELLDGQGPGREILLQQVVPLVDVVERFVCQQGESVIRPGLPVRAALMQLASDVLMRAAAGPIREPLWGARDHAALIARTLFLRDDVTSAEPGSDLQSHAPSTPA